MNNLNKNYKNFNILYVEDEDIIRRNVEHCLGYVFNIIVAKDGQEGLEIFNSNKIDLIITDVNMPNKDGITMLEDIRKISPNIPCIITSAYNVDLFREIEKLCECQYLPKPFDIKELLENSQYMLDELL